jgi:small subunit ribosomal protein S6
MLVVSTRAYEIMIIVDGDEEDAMVDDVVSRVETWLTDGGSKLATTDKWGKRKLAYEINHKTEGHYVVLEMVTEPRDMAPLERTLRLADEVVRHKLIRLPDHEAIRRGLLEAS